MLYAGEGRNRDPYGDAATVGEAGGLSVAAKFDNLALTHIVAQEARHIVSLRVTLQLAGRVTTIVGSDVRYAAGRAPQLKSAAPPVVAVAKGQAVIGAYPVDSAAAICGQHQRRVASPSVSRKSAFCLLQVRSVLRFSIFQSDERRRV